MRDSQGSNREREMRTLWNLIREICSGFFKHHTHCRCCGVSIESGGVGVSFVGMGFCRVCRAEIMRSSARKV